MKTIYVGFIYPPVAFSIYILPVRKNRIEDAKVLVHHGAQLDIQNKQEKTPLELASILLYLNKHLIWFIVTIWSHES